ncbi:SH3 domain-containing protein [Melaminivora alkalimesophila]|uniref:SH3-like domain-containing protein n=1 Tax=Melaminivora alkalimesophila TaxID=1165852 RepID=A0A317R9W8_9BURK|nr:SH3 domain-containing protein [Melaminivora alkalimesophila]PWW45857.1 SH3-like domain-containing protein [Melaminivora alkalimesophila]
MSFALPRLVRWLSTSAAALALAVPALAPAAAQAADFVSIKGATINVREQPTTRSDVLWELGQGYPLQVRERRGQWLRVRDHEATLGWVFAPLTQRTPHRLVTARVANLRAKPSTNSRIVGKLEQHEIVRTVGSQGSWAKVRRDGGQTGWVAKRLTWGW